MCHARVLLSGMFRIINGTPRTGPSLCKTCKHAKHIRGQNCQELVLCHLFPSLGGAPGPVPFRIAECGTYHPVNMPWLHEMEDMAWKIEARKRGAVGFEPETTEMEVVITRPGESNPPSRPASK
jgi:hypothetical protein